MKHARVIHQNKIRFALVGEDLQEVTVVGGSLAFDTNPVRTVIERRITPAELKKVATGCARVRQERIQCNSSRLATARARLAERFT